MLTNYLGEGLVQLGETDTGIENILAPRKEEIYALLSKYIEEIELFNEAYGLVKVRDRDELVVKHILDSLAPLGHIIRLLQNKAAIPAGISIADVGSGAGLPGIPLAICLPSVNVTLIERMGRRAGFLRDVIAVLGLSNVMVEEGEMENAEAGCFDAVVFRAFRSLEPPVLKGLLRLLAPGGFLAAYKGRKLAIKEEMSALEKDMPAIRDRWETEALFVPFLYEERHVTIIEAVR
jgi:16S rRNA (guanine527-N7)-methyltransferase